MSKKSEVQSEAKAELEKCLEKALQRVVSLEQQKLVPLLDHILTLPSQKEHILAAQIHARKERQTTQESLQRLPPDDEKNKLLQAIEDRQLALQNHRIAKNALQSAALNIQMQESVRDSLQKADAEETMDHFTKRGELLSHCGTNLHACKELAALVKEMKELEREIFQLHPTYLSMLNKIRDKWESLQGRVTPTQSQEETRLGPELQKTKRREERIQLLVIMIQGLVSSCGFQWAAYEYYVQLLLYCDSVIMHQDSVTQNGIKKEILKIQNKMETEGEKQ